MGHDAPSEYLNGWIDCCNRQLPLSIDAKLHQSFCSALVQVMPCGISLSDNSFFSSITSPNFTESV